MVKAIFIFFCTGCAAAVIIANHPWWSLLFIALAVAVKSEKGDK